MKRAKAGTKSRISECLRRRSCQWSRNGSVVTDDRPPVVERDVDEQFRIVILSGQRIRGFQLSISRLGVRWWRRYGPFVVRLPSVKLQRTKLQRAQAVQGMVCEISVLGGPRRMWKVVAWLWLVMVLCHWQAGHVEVRLLVKVRLWLNRPKVLLLCCII